MAYDSNCDVIILFGGQDATPHFNDTWKWDGTTWTQLSPPVSPTPRYGSGMVYDSLRQKMVMFGGVGSTGPNFDETWEWDCSTGTWTQVATLPRPLGRIHMGLAFDNTCCYRTVLFGGWKDVSERLNDTWLYPTPGPSGTCIPALSEWGMMAMAALVLSAGGVVIARRRAGQGITSYE